MSKTSKILALIYVFICIFSFFYIKSVLKSENIREKKTADVKIENEYKVDIVLNYYDGGGNVKQLTETMKNTDSIIKFLETLRKHNKIIYEKIDYTYGTEIESVNGLVAPNGSKWAIIEDGKDITLAIAKSRVPKDRSIDLILIKIN